MSTFDLENPEPQPGDSLRDEAANLLTPRFGRPIREARVKGKKVDLYFSRRDFGKEARFYVEAKDYAHNLGRDEVVHIWADYSGIIQANQPATLLLVTRGGLTADAQSFILDERPEMRHQTIWELENETLGLTDYVRSLTTLFDEGGLSSYYVEGRARIAAYRNNDDRVLGDEPLAIFESLKTWMASPDARPVAILGGYGAGKSSLARRLVAAQAQTALADSKGRRPVLIPLGNLARYSSLEGLLGGMFAHDYPAEGFNVRTFLQLNQKGRLLIVLDGFDEMKHAMSWSDFRAQIADLNRLTGGEAKVVMLGRPSAFTSTEEHVHVLRGIKRWDGGWRRLPDWPEFIEYDLEEFTAKERAEFFEGYLRHRMSQLPLERQSESWITNRVAEVERIAELEPELFGKPVHAKILVDLASDPAVDLSRFASGITRWGLYQIFFTSLAEREVEKEVRRPIGEKERITFLREVAFWLWTRRAGATSFSAADLPDSLFAELPSGNAADLESQKREYLTGSFLEKKSGDLYYFGHRSFAEYLVADRMVSNPPTSRNQPIYSGLVRGGVLDFLKDAPDRDSYRRWTDTLSEPMGPIHLEYLAFLAEMLGGIKKLHEALPDTSLWLPILELFDEKIELDASLGDKLIAAMNTEHNVLFFLLLSLFQWQSSLHRSQSERGPVRVAAAILERLFSRATFDEVSRKAAVEPTGDEARKLAQAVIAEVSESFGNRYARFRGRRLMEEKEQRLRTAGTDILIHPPAAMLDLSPDLSLPWSDVLGLLSRDSRTMAVAYFGRSKDLRDVFTRQLRPPSRKVQPRGPAR